MDVSADVLQAAAVSGHWKKTVNEGKDHYLKPVNK